jgi:predicted class III extradiol MEMO1 family dioxygenase
VNKEILEALIYLLNKQTKTEYCSMIDPSKRFTVLGEMEVPDEQAQEIIKKLIKVKEEE